MPKVSVLLPVFNSSKHLKEAIGSILNQTYRDFELIIINEFGSNDGSYEIACAAGKRDSRIVVIQNEIKLGLAKSLNYAIKISKGEYLARMDADDLSRPARFEKQVAFLDTHTNISLCGTWQQYFGSLKHVHKAAVLPEDLFSNLLFECDICHSTVMFRKADFLANNLYYDGTKYAEDYELWVRATHQYGLLFANIPEILGLYRHSKSSLTHTKMTLLHQESAEITRKLLNQLRIILPDSDMMLLGGWINPFLGNQSQLDREKKLLDTIWDNNKKYKIYPEDSLLKALGKRWLWANQIRYNFVDDFDYRLLRNKDLNQVLSRKQKVSRGARTILSRIKRKLKQTIRNIFHIDSILDNLISRLDARIWKAEEGLYRSIGNLSSSVDTRIWAAENKMNNAFNNINNNATDILYRQNLIACMPGEKIRIVFLFQIPSVWASWESVWQVISKDERFDAKMLLFDRKIREVSQMNGSREFLDENNIPFTHADDFSFLDWCPHVLVYQTPWEDEWRPRYLYADQIKKMGIRIVDICYGIPFTNSSYVALRNKFPHLNLKVKPWRVYEISRLKKQDHLVLSPQGAEHVIVTGHPKFDAMVKRDNYQLSDKYKALIKSRKIVFWTLHFVQVYNERAFVPVLREYIKFAQMLSQYPDLFFLVRPHPKFFDVYAEKGFDEEITEFREAISVCENACFHSEHDYRNALFSADYVIGDRSALMVETCALQVPAIFMTNFFYSEEMLPSVAPIFDSYYQGNTCFDIEIFLDVVVKRGLDYKKQERANALQKCLPYLDGNCGQRIADDMADSIYREIHY